MKESGLRGCAKQCINKSAVCEQQSCRQWIDYPQDYNCCLVTVYENGPLTLRAIGDRLGISFARVKQIETAALLKMRKNRLLVD